MGIDYFSNENSLMTGLCIKQCGGSCSFSVQALDTAVAIFHELTLKSNAALRTNKEAGIRENHKIGDRLRNAEVSKG